MLCWHRWRVIEVSPRVAYLKCMRCGKHRYLASWRGSEGPGGGSHSPIGQ